MVRAESAEAAEVPGTTPTVIPAQGGTQPGQQGRRHAAAFLHGLGSGLRRSDGGCNLCGLCALGAKLFPLPFGQDAIPFDKLRVSGFWGR